MRIEDVRIVAVIGAGNMGHGIAQTALMSGFKVHLCDVSEEFVQSGENRIHASLEKFLSKGKISKELVDRIENGLLFTFTSITDAVCDADIVAEAVPEIEEMKIEVFQEIDRAAKPEAIIATNTSTMSIRKFAESINRRDKIVGMHYFIPVVMMDLVEVIRCEYTSEETAELACDYVRKIGKKLIFAKKDTPGFIANRIFAPVIVLNSRVLDVDKLAPADVDFTMRKYGGLRMGPYELLDFGGIDVIDMCQKYYHNHLDEEYGLTGTSRVLVDNGFFGKKTGKGYFEWPKDGSRPQITEADYTGKYDSELFFFVEANEATKLFEEGVCTLAECDTAMVYGFNSPAPVAYTRKFAPEYVSSKLDAAAAKYACNLFRATETIRTGRYLKEE